MKKIIIILILLNNFQVFSQKAKVTYLVSTSSYKESLKAKKNFSKNNLDILRNASDIEYNLFINKNKSYYKKEESLKVDVNSINMTSVLGGRGTYFYDLNTDVNLHLKDLKKITEKDLFIKYEKISWKLTNETKKIGKYTCLKATAVLMRKHRDGYIEKKIIAWYTPEIPLSFGPKFYNGLPGLIISLQEGNKLHLIAKTINLNPKEDIIIPDLPKDIEIISFKEYENMISKRFEDFRRRKKR